MRLVATVAVEHCKTLAARQYRRMLDVAFAIIGFGMAISALFLPLKYSKISKWVIDGGMILGSGLCGAGIALIFASLQNPSPVAAPQPTQRHLTGDQKVCLTHTLEKLQKIYPTFYMFNVNDAETDKYAADFFELFHALGFNVSDGYRNVFSIDTGIVIELQDIRNPPKNALIFEDDLQSCGLDLTVEQANPVGDFDLVITDPPP